MQNVLAKIIEMYTDKRTQKRRPSKNSLASISYNNEIVVRNHNYISKAQQLSALTTVVELRVLPRTKN